MHRYPRRAGLDEMAEKIMQDKAITTPCKQTVHKLQGNHHALQTDFA